MTGEIHLIKNDDFNSVYNIGDKIGDGHFAEVFVCSHRKSQEEYAAKFIKKKSNKPFSLDPENVGMSMIDIEKEAKILSQLSHDNIIKLFDVYNHGESVILVIELVTGGELFARVAECERLSEEEASGFVNQILCGVEHIHSKGIVHLDLKPENIMIEDLASRKIKIIDFGLARQLKENEPFQDMAGTPEFCAPEIVNFDPITFATDMWAIGVITYILLTGISPFAGDTQIETFQNILDCYVEYERDEMDGVSNLAKDFIKRLLIRNPKKRATVQDCLQHPWIKPKDSKQMISRRSSTIIRDKLNHLKNFVVSPGGTHYQASNNSSPGIDIQNQFFTSPSQSKQALENPSPTLTSKTPPIISQIETPPKPESPHPTVNNIPSPSAQKKTQIQPIEDNEPSSTIILNDPPKPKITNGEKIIVEDVIERPHVMKIKTESVEKVPIEEDIMKTKRENGSSAQERKMNSPKESKSSSRSESSVEKGREVEEPPQLTKTTTPVSSETRKVSTEKSPETPTSASWRSNFRSGVFDRIGAAFNAASNAISNGISTINYNSPPNNSSTVTRHQVLVQQTSTSNKQTEKDTDLSLPFSAVELNANHRQSLCFGNTQEKIERGRIFSLVNTNQEDLIPSNLNKYESDFKRNYQNIVSVNKGITNSLRQKFENKNSSGGEQVAVMSTSLITTSNGTNSISSSNGKKSQPVKVSTGNSLTSKLGWKS